MHIHTSKKLLQGSARKDENKWVHVRSSSFLNFWILIEVPCRALHISSLITVGHRIIISLLAVNSNINALLKRQYLYYVKKSIAAGVGLISGYYFKAPSLITNRPRPQHYYMQHLICNVQQSEYLWKAACYRLQFFFFLCPYCCAKKGSGDLNTFNPAWKFTVFWGGIL